MPSALLVLFFLFNLATTHLASGWMGAPGLVFFNSITGLNLLFISLAGLSYFSSAITKEKEETTLGLLRMTNLNPLSILLGKSASRQIGALHAEADDQWPVQLDCDQRIRLRDSPDDFFDHPVADLSLRLKWGALPLSIAIAWVGTSMITGMALLMFKEAAFFILDRVVGIFIVVLHDNIGHRLETLAEED